MKHTLEYLYVLLTILFSACLLAAPVAGRAWQPILAWAALAWGVMAAVVFALALWRSR